MDLDVFDKAVSKRNIPSHFKAGATETADTLKLCWAAAQSAFGAAAKPEHAIALLPTMLKRADEKLQSELALAQSGTASANAQ